MARRSVNWEIGLARRLHDKEFAHHFIRAALEDEGLPLQLVLGTVVRAYGVKEFAAKIKMPSSNLIRAINPKYNPTLATLDKLLKPFKLRVTVAPMEKKLRA